LIEALIKSLLSNFEKKKEQMFNLKTLLTGGQKRHELKPLFDDHFSKTSKKYAF